MPPRVEVCKVEDVGAGEVRKFEAGGLVLAVYNLDGAFYATDDACTHGPGSLSEGFVDGCHIECNFHQGVFDIRTGAVVQPPCIVPIKTYKTIVEQGTVYVEP
jgi:nitrite reductase/ring-hydroxylating ferredoxin subunit